MILTTLLQIVQYVSCELDRLDWSMHSASQADWVVRRSRVFYITFINAFLVTKVLLVGD